MREKSFEQDKMPPESSHGPADQKSSGPDRIPGATRTHETKGVLAELPTTLFRGVDRVLDKLLGEYASLLRSSKPMLFGIAGFLGAAAGALLAEAVPRFQRSHARLGEGLYTGLYSAVAAGILTVALALAGEYYLRRMELSWRVLLRPLFSGAAAGAVAGAMAGFIYGSSMFVEYWREILFRPICWGVMGCLLGWRLSALSPNLGLSRSLAGGAIGGVIGGFAFLFTALLFPQFIGRVVGFGVMGACLGLALVAVDSLFRDAVLEVIWARNETTSIPLGSRPVYVGGGDDHVSIPGLAEHAVSITLEGGRIRYGERATGKKVDLKDGSSIKIGSVELLIHAKPTGQKPIARQEAER